MSAPTAKIRITKISALREIALNTIMIMIIIITIIIRIMNQRLLQ